MPYVPPSGARWQRPIPKIMGNNYVEIIALKEGQTLPPTLPNWVQLSAAAQAGATSISFTTEGGIAIDPGNVPFLAFEVPSTGEERLVRFSGSVASATTLACQPLDEDIPNLSYAYLPLKIKGISSFDPGERSKETATSAPLDTDGNETLQVTTRGNEASCQQNLYELGDDYLTLARAADKNLTVWVIERSAVPKAGFAGEIREYVAHVSGPGKNRDTDIPQANWKFLRTGAEYITYAKKAS